jgi:hypothetical protein
LTSTVRWLFHFHKTVKDKTNPESIENNGVARIRKWDARSSECDKSVFLDLNRLFIFL